MRRAIYLLIIFISPLTALGQIDSIARNESILENILGEKKESQQFTKRIFMHQLDSYVTSLQDPFPNGELIAPISDSVYIIQKKKILQNYVERNIFDKDSVVTVDSNMIIPLIRQYDAMVKLNQVIGVHKYLHFDLDQGALRELLLAAQDFISYEKVLFSLTQSLLKNSYNNNIDSLMLSTVQVLEEVKTLQKLNLNYWDDSPNLKLAFDWQEVDKPFDAITTKLNRVLTLARNHPSDTIFRGEYERASQYIDKLVADQINFYEQQTILLKIEEKYLNSISKKDYANFALFNLLIVNRYVRYDTAWVNFKTEELKRWLKDVGLDTLLKFEDIRIGDRGNFNVSFNIPRLSNANDRKTWSNFQIRYKAKNNQEITEMLFFKLSSFFGLPTEMIDMHISYSLGWIDYSFLNNKIIASGGVLLSGSSETRIKNFAVSRIAASLSTPASATVKPRGKEVNIEKIVYEALEKYFISRHIPLDDNIQCIKMEDNEVKIFLNNTRKEVLKTESFWENVQFDFFIYPEANDLKIKLIVDAEYGTGITLFSGAIGRPPHYSAYMPTEPKYKQQLQRYTNDLLYKIKDLIAIN
jgi:hypothetical protein